MWQPIETAPKDGTPILIYTVIPGVSPEREANCDYIDIAFYLYRSGRSENDPRNWVRVGRGDPTCGVAGGNAVGAATHWMPLPDPPTT